MDGHPLDGYVDVSDELPRHGEADRIHIVGRCDAYYIGSGDDFNPWVEVASREVSVAVTPDHSFVGEGIVVLSTFVGHHTTRLELERRDSGEFRLRLAEAGVDSTTDWFDGRDGFRVVVRGCLALCVRDRCRRTC